MEKKKHGCGCSGIQWEMLWHTKEGGDDDAVQVGGGGESNTWAAKTS